MDRSSLSKVRVAAIKATHPDQNPDVDPVEFRRVAKALELVK